jgi:hypothetical protein
MCPLQTPLKTKGLICFLSLILLPSPLWAYGYERNEDPLLKVFKAVIYYGKASDWKRVQKEVDSIADRFEDVKKLFGTDLKPKIDEAIKNRDLQETAKLMANMVFLAKDIETVLLQAFPYFDPGLEEAIPPKG